MENYEEKYKQALKRARTGLHDCNLLNCDDMARKAAITTIYRLFPELIEDEDERIRKGIIRNLQYLMDRSEGFVKEDLQERIAWLEKQGEQKTSDKDKQNFKVGNWIVFNGLVLYIYDIVDGYYKTVDIDNIPCSYDWVIDNIARLWTINDAKDGDVLAINWHEGDDSWEKIIIFKKYHNKGVKGIYSMPCVEGYGNTFKNGKLAFHEEVPYYSKTWTDNLHPATKEQCDLLFEEMTQAGYEWDAEKKELKKIEPKTFDPDRVIAWLVANICDFEYYVKQFKKDFDL